MKISQDCIDLVKKFEGCKLKAYRCPAGILTVGYGSTGPHVKAGMVITQAQADALLLKDLQRFEEGVDKLVTNTLLQGMFDALVSFSFNVGLDNLRKSTILKLINAGNHFAAAYEFSKWNKAGGKVLPGLTKRREAEAQLFLKG